MDPATMQPKTQVIIGNCAGAATLLSLLIAISGMITGVFALQLFLIPFGVAYLIRMRMDHRHDRIRIMPDGAVYLNGRLSSVDQVIEELPLSDPRLEIRSIEAKLDEARYFREGPAAFRPQIPWFLWIDREYDSQHVPEQAVTLIARLQALNVPFACTWDGRLSSETRRVDDPS